MKRLQLVVIFLFLLISGLVADTQNNTKKVIKIGYLENYGIISEPLVQGKEGFGYEIFKEISKYTNHTFEYVKVEWGDALSSLEQGKIDIFGPANTTAERLQKFEYTKTIFGYEDIILLALKDSDYYYGDKEAFNDARIGVFPSGTYEVLLKKYLQKNNLESQIVEIPDNNTKKDIENGLYDLRLEGSLYSGKGVKIVEEINSLPFYFLSQKGNTDLIDEIDSAINSIISKDRLFLERLFLKYYGNTEVAKRTLSIEELSMIREKECYTVSYNNNYHPLSYSDKEGNPKGIAIDVMKEIAKELDINVTFVEERPANNSNIDFDLCVLCENNSTKTNITYPYMTLPMMSLKHSGMLNAEITEVVVLTYNSIDLDNFLDPYKNAQLITKKTVGEAYSYFQENKNACFITTSEIANAILDAKSMQAFDFYPTSLSLPFSIVASEHISHEITDILSNTIKGFEDNFVKSIIIKNISALDTERTTGEFIQEYRYIFVTAIFIIVLSFFCIIILLTKKKKTELQTLVETDELTKIYTKHKFLLEVNKILKNAQPEEYALISIDIDNFKHINESLGFHKGNEILKNFAHNLTTLFHGKAIIAREHGDVFLVFKKNPMKENFFDSPNPKEILSQGFTDDFGNEIKISISVGLCIVKDPSTPLDYLLDWARIARGQGKNTYGLTIVKYTEEMNSLQLKKNTITTHMEDALANNEFFIVYQPKYNLITNKLHGAEALIRWNNNLDKNLSPADFIPIFESNGFIVNIDYFVFDKVCELISQANFELPVISVNLSGVTALQNDLIENYTRILKKHNVSANKIEIEITETAFSNEINLLTKRLEELQALGFSISIDDFGTGVSSLSRLRDVSANILKLDISFINSSFLSKKGLCILKNIIFMAKDLNIQTVAEGIETESQLEILRELGCDLGQGYYFAKPLSHEDFFILLGKK